MSNSNIKTCNQCGQSWESRKANPVQCPRCKRVDWKLVPVVCVWEKMGDLYYVPCTGDFKVPFKDWSFCSYCGKKIVIKEGN